MSDLKPSKPDECGIPRCKERGLDPWWDFYNGRWKCRCALIGSTDTGLLRPSWHAAWWDDASGKWFWTTRSFADTGLSKLATDTSNMALGSNI